MLTYMCIIVISAVLFYVYIMNYVNCQLFVFKYLDVIQVRLRENWRLCELYKKSSELHLPCCTLFPTGKREIKLLVTVVLTSKIMLNVIR